jgi:nitroreductase
MNTLEAIEARKSIRSYTDKTVEESIIDKVVTAGTQAASAVKLRLTVITKKDVLQIISTEATYIFRSSGNKALKEKASAFDFNALYNAPVLIVVSAEKTVTGRPSPLAFPSAGCAAQNMMLAATDYELGSCFIQGIIPAFANPNVSKAACIDPNDTPICAVLIGYTNDHESRGARPLAASVRYVK